MINILPIKEKKKNLTEYRFRLAIVAILAVVVLVLINLILLIPSYLLTVSKFNGVSEQIALQESKQDSSGQGKDVEAKVSAVNKKISMFLADGPTDRLSPPAIIARIIAMKGSAIKIQGFEYDGSGQLERLAVTGVAADRDGLAKFLETLKKDKSFTNVELPVSSFVKSSNIKFSLMITRGVIATPAKR